jgi:hypothetical protein
MFEFYTIGHWKILENFKQESYSMLFLPILKDHLSYYSQNGWASAVSCHRKRTVREEDQEDNRN